MLNLSIWEIEVAGCIWHDMKQKTKAQIQHFPLQLWVTWKVEKLRGVDEGGENPFFLTQNNTTWFCSTLARITTDYVCCYKDWPSVSGVWCHVSCCPSTWPIIRKHTRLAGIFQLFVQYKKEIFFQKIYLLQRIFTSESAWTKKKRQHLITEMQLWQKKFFNWLYNHLLPSQTNISTWGGELNISGQTVVLDFVPPPTPAAYQSTKLARPSSQYHNTPAHIIYIRSGSHFVPQSTEICKLAKSSLKVCATKNFLPHQRCEVSTLFTLKSQSLSKATWFNIYMCVHQTKGSSNKTL